MTWWHIERVEGQPLPSAQLPPPDVRQTTAGMKVSAQRDDEERREAAARSTSKHPKIDFFFDLALVVGFAFAIWLHPANWLPYFLGTIWLTRLLLRWMWPSIRDREERTDAS